MPRRYAAEALSQVTRGIEFGVGGGALLNAHFALQKAENGEAVAPFLLTTSHLLHHTPVVWCLLFGTFGALSFGQFWLSVREPFTRLLGSRAFACLGTSTVYAMSALATRAAPVGPGTANRLVWASILMLIAGATLGRSWYDAKVSPPNE